MKTPPGEKARNPLDYFASMGGTSKRRGRLVLAVDDDESILDLYDQHLPMIGFEVRLASTGKQVRSRLRKEVPDVILMDVMMADEDGLTLTKEIRADPRTAEIPIIVVSGLTDAAVLNDALLCGANDFVTKPFEIEVLKTKLERAIALSRGKK